MKDSHAQHLGICCYFRVCQWFWRCRLDRSGCWLDWCFLALLYCFGGQDMFRNFWPASADADEKEQGQRRQEGLNDRVVHGCVYEKMWL